MTDTPPPPHDDLKALWRAQQTESHPMTLELIHARGFQSRVKRRNMIEYVASIVVVAAFTTYIFVLPDPLLKLASAMIVAATFVVAWQLYRRGSARTLPDGASALTSLAFHRAELVRQRDALRSVWLWYLAPFVPGMALFWLAPALSHPHWPAAKVLFGPAITIAFFVFVAVVNAIGARKLQRQIDELDALGTDGA